MAAKHISPGLCSAHLLFRYASVLAYFCSRFSLLLMIRRRAGADPGPLQLAPPIYPCFSRRPLAVRVSCCCFRQATLLCPPLPLSAWRCASGSLGEQTPPPCTGRFPSRLLHGRIPRLPLQPWKCCRPPHRCANTMPRCTLHHRRPRHAVNQLHQDCPISTATISAIRLTQETTFFLLRE